MAKVKSTYDMLKYQPSARETEDGDFLDVEFSESTEKRIEGVKDLLDKWFSCQLSRDKTTLSLNDVLPDMAFLLEVIDTLVRFCNVRTLLLNVHERTSKDLIEEAVMWRKLVKVMLEKMDREAVSNSEYDAFINKEGHELMEKLNEMFPSLGDEDIPF